MTEDRSPAFGKGAMTCPHCKVFSKQRWVTCRGEFRLTAGDVSTEAGCPIIKFRYSEHYNPNFREIYVSQCDACEQNALWWKGKLLIPASHLAPDPNPDMPDDAKADYLEAASIAEASPRGAGALLRLCLEKILEHLEPGSGNINTKIGNLVGRGLSPVVQKVLDVIRVTGNNAVHPGKISIDSYQDVMIMFQYINMIVYQMISQPKQVEDAYSGLPQSILEAIQKRDQQAS